MKYCSLQAFEKYTLNVYRNICWLLTTALVGYSISLYLQDRDISRVSHVKFHSRPKDIYPSLSLCFGDILEKETLDARGFNKTLYSDFLIGKNWNKTFLDLNFDEVSINLERYLLAIEMFKEGYNGDVAERGHFLFDNTRHQGEKAQDSPAWRPNIYQDTKPFWGLIQKCITFDVPLHSQQPSTWMTVVMSKSVFKSGKRPASSAYAKNLFSVEIHYPRQRYRYAEKKMDWHTEEPQHNILKSYGMKFRINNMEVMNQRSTRRIPCNENSIEEDQALKASLIRAMNCTPPYWIQTKDMGASRCSSQDQIETFYRFDIENFAAPCRRLSHINFEYSEYPSSYYDRLFETGSLKGHRNRPGSSIKNVSLDSFYVGLVFTHETYKEVYLTKQFDLQSLIGNAGGYIGMCVGFSLLQLPQIIVNIISRLKNADDTNKQHDYIYP